MNSSIFIIVWVGFCYSCIYTLGVKSKNDSSRDDKYPALIVTLYKDRRYSSEHAPFLTACPASSQREHKFNQEVSITGKSVFVRNLYKENDTVKLEFCDKPIEPAVVYNVETDAYEIGYELYRKKDKIMLEDRQIKLESEFYAYHRYKSVDINNRIINQTKPLNESSFVIELENSTNTEFAFTDGSSTMAFHWLQEIPNIISEENHRQIIRNDGFYKDEFNTERNIFSVLSVEDYNLKSKCQDFLPNKKQPNLSFFSTKNQKNPKQESATAEQLHQRKEIGIRYGDMTLSQIIPLGSFYTFFGQLASCTNINMVPIWTSIAEGQLKKVDLYLQAVIAELNCEIERMVFGVAGILALHNDTDEKMFACDTDHQQITPIPKLIYRVVEAECGIREKLNAIIVVHNDPVGVSDEDRICQEEEELASWNKIKNNDPKSGVTYVCDYQTKKIISDKFGIIVRSDTKPLELDNVPSRRGEYFFDDVESIEYEFEKLINNQE